MRRRATESSHLRATFLPYGRFFSISPTAAGVILELSWVDTRYVIRNPTSVPLEPNPWRERTYCSISPLMTALFAPLPNRPRRSFLGLFDPCILYL